MGLELIVPVPPGYGLLRPNDLSAIKSAILYGDDVTVLMHLSTHMATGLLVGAPDDQRAAFLKRSVEASIIERAGYPVTRDDDKSLGESLRRMTSDFEYITQPTNTVRLDLVYEDNVFLSEQAADGEPILKVRIDPGVDKYTQRLEQLLLTTNPPSLLIPSSTSVSAASDDRLEAGRSLDLPLAIGLLTRLPGFAAASLEEIIDIRSELEVPLIRFRAAVVDMSIDNLADAADVELIWMKSVEPALRDIDELIHENKYLRQLITQLLDPVQGAVAVAGVAVGVGALNGVPQLLVAGLTALMPSLRAAWERHVGFENLQKQRFFFLHQVSVRLRN